MNIKNFYPIVLIAVLLGCGTTPKKVDVSTIPMPDTRAVKRTPGSIWPGESRANALFTDFRARMVGDIVTILIIEKTQAVDEAITETSRDSSVDLSASTLFGMPLDLGMTNFMGLGNAFNPALKGAAKNSFTGDASTERTGEITATIAMRVTKILPNGNLFIEGTKETMINKEKQHIVLSGIIRPEDVSSKNTVKSDSVSDLRVELSGYGVVSNKQGDGWLAQIMNVVWPF